MTEAHSNPSCDPSEAGRTPPRRPPAPAGASIPEREARPDERANEPPAVVVLSVTEAGRRLATALPYPAHHGDVRRHLEEAWDAADGIVLVIAAGAAVRLCAPLLRDKTEDPAVVAVDDAGRFAVALLGGHHGRRGLGANALARKVASFLGATPVCTTASEGRSCPPLDALVGYRATGDVAAVQAALLNGRPVALRSELRWPFPAALEAWVEADEAEVTPDLTAPAGSSPRPPAGAIVLTDRADPARPRPPGGIGESTAAPARPRATPDGLGDPGSGESDHPGGPECRDSPPTVRLHPASLVVGIGTATTASPSDVRRALDAALSGAGLASESVGLVATIDRRRDHPALVSVGRPIVGYPASLLATYAVPHPSETVAHAVGTPSVAEAAALAGAGPGAELVVDKQVFPRVTVAVARRRPESTGHLAVVGIGPGTPWLRTPLAEREIRQAEEVVGYGGYLDLIEDLLGPHQAVHRFPLGAELERCDFALERAAAGRRVALVCSGDPGVYALAGLVLERAEFRQVPLRPAGPLGVAAGEPGKPTTSARPAAIGGAGPVLTIVPGVTAASAAAARLGAPIGHDHVVISLSTLLTPWSTISRRLEAAAAADLVVVLYNPRARERRWQLPAALELLRRARGPNVPTGVVTAAGRPGERVRVVKLGSLDPAEVDMVTTVVVGSRATRAIVGPWLVTPRGYGPRDPRADPRADPWPTP